MPNDLPQSPSPPHDSDPTPPAEPASAHSLSKLFAALADGPPEEPLTLAQLRRELGERAFGLMILVLAIPNCLPVAAIPGFSVLTGAGLVFFTLQLCLDQPEPYLPRWLMRRAVARGKLSASLGKTIPFLRWIERFIAPRWSTLVTGTGERVMGAVALLLSVTLLLPIPFANFLPAAALSLFALALVSRDGLFSVLGYLVTAATAWFLPALFSGALGLAETLATRYL